MSKERQSSYFLRTQSTLLNGEKQINYNSLRDKITDNKYASNKKYLSAGKNKKKNKRYISKNENQKKVKQKTKRSYVGIDLQKVSGSTHFINNKIIKKIENIIPEKNSLNYYQYLTKKNNKKKEEEKNINETTKKNIYQPSKSNHYSPFHDIISNLKEKNQNNNVIHKNIDVNNFVINTHSNSRENNNKKEKNKQYFSFSENNNIEKEELNDTNNNKNYIRTYNNNTNNNHVSQNDTRYTYIYSKYNHDIKYRNLYLNDNIINDDMTNKKIYLMNQIKSITNSNPNNINNNENIQIYNKYNNTKINNNYTSTNFNYNIIHNNNSVYSPLPYKSFLRSIFDQNNTNKFIKDFNIISTSRKIDNHFDYDKNDENNLKKMLENIPKHLKVKNKSEIFFSSDNKNNNCDSKRKKGLYNILNNNSKEDNRNSKQKFFGQINNIMPPNKLIEEKKENFN